MMAWLDNAWAGEAGKWMRQLSIGCTGPFRIFTLTSLRCSAAGRRGTTAVIISRPCWGRVLLDRELYLPQVWAEGWESRGTRGFCFQTKPQLARWMLESGVPFAWVAGD